MTRGVGYAISVILRDVLSDVIFGTVKTVNLTSSLYLSILLPTTAIRINGNVKLTNV